MKLDPIISALRERCPSFHQRVGGAAQWAGLERAENAPVPFAYVAPLREDAGAQESNNGYYQVITNTFGVIVVVPNCADERGQDAGRWLEVLRPEIFRAILSWHMKPKDEFSEIVYEGGVLIYIDAARAAYQFEFSFETYIDTSDTYQKVELDALSPFDGMDVDVDCIDPSMQKDHIRFRIREFWRPFSASFSSPFLSTPFPPPF